MSGPALARAGRAAGPRRQVMTAAVLRGLWRFAHTRGIPASWEYLLDYDVIEALCMAGLAGRAPATRGTYRSVLYRLAAPVHGPPGPRATPFAGAEGPGPGRRSGRAAAAGEPGAGQLHLRSPRPGYPAGRAAGRQRDQPGRIAGPLRPPRRWRPGQGRFAGPGQTPAGGLSMGGCGLEIPEPGRLRPAFITAALDAGVPLRDVQEAVSHADPRTTMRYDRARAFLGCLGAPQARHLHRRRLRRRSRPIATGSSSKLRLAGQSRPGGNPGAAVSAWISDRRDRPSIPQIDTNRRYARPAGGRWPQPSGCRSVNLSRVESLASTRRVTTGIPPTRAQTNAIPTPPDDGTCLRRPRPTTD